MIRYVQRSCGKHWKYGVSVDVLGFRAINQASEACVKVGSGLSEWFEGKQGVRQGYPMLIAMAFYILLDMVVREARAREL